MARKFGLDLLRACAICLVLVSHLVGKSLTYIGMYGVELFFALSGFLIGGILYRKLAASPRWSFEDVRTFWLRRWWRTLPNYYLFLGISLPLQYFIFKESVPTITAAIPFFIFSQNLFSAGSSFYGVSWSLCVEEWFYLLFPTSILLFTSLRFSKQNAFICTTLLFILFPPILREFMFANNEPALIRFMTLPRLDALFYGVAMSFVLARYPIVSSQKITLLATSFVGLIGLFIFQYHCNQINASVSFYRAAFLVLPICFSLILPFFASIEQPSRWTYLVQPITNLSLWSYSIYLSHIPILFATYAIFGVTRESVGINVLSKLVGLAACFIISSLIYKYFESPLMSLRPPENSPCTAAS
jgi:peptidoglycan/LPS O-acetylase OafA/YrhL